MAIEAGTVIRQARLRRRWSLASLAERSGLSTSHVADVESGAAASLETYARLMTALELEPQLIASDRRRKIARRGEGADLVHAAMGEIEARLLTRAGFAVGIDEPYQHYQFAGRADVIAWEPAARALLHIENRTRFPNVQDALGSYATKRAYLGGVLAARLGVPGGWASETHVIAALWSSEVLHVLRRRGTTFRAACPENGASFRAWLAGDVGDLRGTTSSLTLLDPTPGVREAYRFGDLTGATRPRHRGYAEVAKLLRSE